MAVRWVGVARGCEEECVRVMLKNCEDGKTLGWWRGGRLKMN